MAQPKKKEKTSKVIKEKFSSQAPEPIHALTNTGQQYLDAIDTGSVIFAKGCAGVGKSYMAILRACELMQRGDFRKIVITKPNIEMGKSLGFKPGTEEEKLMPFMKHMRAIIRQQYGAGWLASQESNFNIEFVDLASVQGATFDNTIIILDEAEHLSITEMYIILTRIGKYSKLIINGDTRQVFSGRASGLTDAIKRLAEVFGVYTVTFTSQDVVRSGICRDIIEAYEE